MLMSRLPVPTIPQGRGEQFVVRLLRRWVACRQMGEPTTPSLVRLADALDGSVQAAVALDSLLFLTEGMLGRTLIAGRCGDRELSADERGVLLLLAHARRAGPVHTTRAMPHGLAGPLAFAVASVRLALGLEPSSDPPPSTCPFV